MRFAINLLYFFVIIFLSLSFVSASSVGLIENQTWQGNLTAVRFSALAFGDIDNDGDLDLALIGCLNDGADDCENGVIAKIYINNGTNLVENFTWQQNLTAVGYGSLALGDIDNDGDLDLALNGVRNSVPYYISKIYVNNGTSFVENQTWQQNLTGVYEGELALGDIDNDGDLDLALTGDTGTPADFTKIYINDGARLVEDLCWGTNLTNMDRSSVLWSDYDNDGDLDLSLIGHTNGDHFNIYKNNGSSLVENQTRNMILNGLIGMYRATAAFGDYDNDGDLDLAAMGNEHGYARVYENNQINNHYFVQDAIAHANISDEIVDCSLAWGDINNDGNLDLVVAGLDFATTLISKIYISNNTINNTPPQPPNSIFSAIYKNNQISLGWGNGSDNETPMAGLYYNLRVGTTSGGNQIVSGVYGGSSGGGGGGGGSAGYFGNMMQRKNITLHSDWLQANTTYYWSVQTIDTGLAKSAWSTEQTFTTSNDITYPEISLNGPDDNNYTSFTNITFNATVSDNVNVSNVSLYGSWDGWHRNQTNSSGLNGTDYIFQVNLSDYPEGTYIWAIHACDVNNNCWFSQNRTVIRDLTYPLIYLETPLNASSWTDNNSVTFFFNVTDLAITNCSLIVNSLLKYNFSSVTINTSTSVSIDLDNGNYNWSINCTDMLLRQNNSETRQLTVNYQAPVISSGGSSGGGIPARTYVLGELEKAQEVNKELRKGDKINFNLNERGHNLTISSITKYNATIEINSTIARFTLGIGEGRMLNLTNNEFYDLFVRLNYIKDLKANITMRKILEVISPGNEGKPTANKTEKKEEKPVETEEKEKLAGKKPYLMLFILIAILALSYWIFKNRDEKRKTP